MPQCTHDRSSTEPVSIYNKHANGLIIMATGIMLPATTIRHNRFRGTTSPSGHVLNRVLHVVREISNVAMGGSDVGELMFRLEVAITHVIGLQGYIPSNTYFELIEDLRSLLSAVRTYELEQNRGMDGYRTSAAIFSGKTQSGAVWSLHAWHA